MFLSGLVIPDGGAFAQNPLYPSPIRQSSGTDPSSNVGDFAPGISAPVITGPGINTGSTSSPVVKLFGQVGKFGALTDDVQQSIGLKCSNTQDGETEISEVLKGSNAYNAGLHKGDRITGAVQKSDSIFALSVQDRAGKSMTFNFEIKATRNSYTALLPRPDAAQTGKPPFLLNAMRAQTGAERNQTPAILGTINEAVKLLANYDVELIVDKSFSMRRRDCPGMLSRWEWCASQSQELGRQLAPFVPQGISIIPFARFYDSYEHQQPQQIANMFYGTQLEKGTRLAEPLADRLNRAIIRRASGAKPTIIAIITDGIPAPAYEPQMVVDVLINASRQMRNSQDVTVVFFPNWCARSIRSAIPLRSG